MIFSLIIPCFNEARGLDQLAARCRALLDAVPDAEIILVDNGSTDGTATILDEIADNGRLRSVRLAANRGYGGGILAGLAAARGDVIGWTHADLQTDPMDALGAFELFERSRAPERLFVKGRRSGRPLADALFTAGMSLFETVLLGKAMSDINAQPTFLHRAAYARWTKPPVDFSLDLFAYYRAKRDRLSIKRILVRFHKRPFGTSHWNVNWAAKRKFIRRTVEFSIRLRGGMRQDD